MFSFATKAEVDEVSADYSKRNIVSILRHLLPKAILFLKVHFVIKIFWFLTHPDTFQKTQLASSLSLFCSGRKTIFLASAVIHSRCEINDV